jgi:hypothetical protein
MEIETRLLEECKANNDLLKFYEDLKQKRFAHFLTIQTAFLAFFGLVSKDALAVFFHDFADGAGDHRNTAAHHFVLLHARRYGQQRSSTPRAPACC